MLKSHFLSAGLYKAVMQGHAPHDNAPVMMDVTKSIAVQSSAQMRKPLLCTHCEQRFSRNGEAHVIANCHRKDGQFKLRDTLKGLKASTTANRRAVFYGHTLPADFKAEAYHYFFISVLWRASVTNWPGIAGLKKGCLGPRYEESFRRYLLGEISAPENTLICIYVNFEPDPTAILAFPTHSKTVFQEYKVVRHSFHIPGVRFMALIGGNVSRIEAGGSGWKPGFPTFFEWHMRDTDLHRRLVQDAKQTVAKGKLAAEE